MGRQWRGEEKTCIVRRKKDKVAHNLTSIVTASMRRAVGVEVLKVDLRPREEVSAHWEAEERGLPRTSRLRETVVKIALGG